MKPVGYETPEDRAVALETPEGHAQDAYSAYPAELAAAARAVEAELVRQLTDTGLTYEITHATYVFRRLVVPLVHTAAARLTPDSLIGPEYWAALVSKRAKAEADAIFNIAEREANVAGRIAAEYLKNVRK